MESKAYSIRTEFTEEGDITGDEDYGLGTLLEDISDTVGYGEDGRRWFSTREVSDTLASRYCAENQEGFLGALLDEIERETTSKDLNIIDKMLGQKREEGDVLGEYREEGYRWQLNE